MLVGRVVLAQRVTLELRVHEDAAQVGVAAEGRRRTCRRSRARTSSRSAQRSRQRVDLGAVAVLVADARLDAQPVAPARASRGAATTSKRGIAIGIVDAARSTNMSQRERGSSRRKRATSLPARRVARPAVSSPSCECVSRIASPNCRLRAARRASGSCSRSELASSRARRELHGPRSDRDRILARLDDAGRAIAALRSCPAAASGRRARPRAAADSRDVDVAGDDLVDAGDGRVVVVEAAARRAGAEREHPLGLGHLLVDALAGRAPGAG